MNNLNKENFFNELPPDTLDDFLKFIDLFKTRVQWNELFGTPEKPAPKFHEIPYEMQFGIMLSYFHNRAGIVFLKPIESIPFFSELFRSISTGDSHGVESTGCVLVTMERKEHNTKHGFDHDSDKAYSDGELAKFATALITGEDSHYPAWMAREKLDRYQNATKKKKLVVACSLLIAEIDRIIYEESLNDGNNNQAGN